MTERRRCPGLRLNCSNPFSVVVGDALLRIETPGSGYATKLPLTQSHVKRFLLNPLLRNPPQSLRNMPVFQQKHHPSQRSKPNPTPERMNGHYAAAVAAAAVMFACSVAAAHAAQQVAASYSLGTWSTAALSVARQWLAATSLPNLGVAIFAGGYSTCCFVDFSCRCVLRCFGWGIGWLSGRRFVC